jgi:class 3 adenylate cyclase/tetratricopeptide (TPR) repeat protein
LKVEDVRPHYYRQMPACSSCGTDNPPGARFCNACGERLDAAFPPQEVRKTVTVVFCDVTGSTALGERLDPETLRRVMMRYFGAMTEAIERHGGTVEKFIGDAVMAVFGLPTVHEDDAVRAVRAAEGMREALHLLNKELERDHGATLACRVGVNTGEVVAGDATLRQALVTGDAVNVAARLEQAAPPGGVLISERTLRLVRDAVVVEPVEPLELKGKSERVPAFRLFAVNPGAAGVARRLDTPMVGRSRELAQLRQAFEEVVGARSCRLVTVLGAAGVGKSRLVQEMLTRFADDAMILRGRCLSYGEGVTYRPIADVVCDAFGSSAVPDTATIEAMLPDDPSNPQVAAQLAALVDGGGDIVSTSEDVSWAVRRFLESIARRGPLIVVLDDIHWAEHGLLDLIDQLSDRIRDAPILLIGTARPDLLEVRPDWGSFATIALEPLGTDEMGELVATILAGGAVDPAIQERIAVTTEGNPLFVEETLTMLLEEGRLRTEDDRWVAPDLGAFAIPSTVDALLSARLDRLDAPDRAVLGRASVIGEVFSVDAVRDLAPAAERDEAHGRIERLVRRQMIRPASSGATGEFRFHHALLRDAAYRMLPKESRAELHERFADLLEAQGDLPDLEVIASFHLEQAHRLRTELGPDDDRSRALAARAVAHLSAFAATARYRGDGSGAAGLYARADALREPTDPGRVRDLVAAGWASIEADRVTDAEERFELAREVARTLGNETAGVSAELSTLFLRMATEPEGAADALRDAIDDALPRLARLELDAELALAYFLRAQVHMDTHAGKSRNDADRAMHHAETSGDRVLLFNAAQLRCVAGLLGDTPVGESRGDIEEFQHRFQDSSFARIRVATDSATALAMLGRFDEAWDLLDRADEIGQQMHAGRESAALSHRGTVALLADHPEAAAPAFAAAFERLMSVEDVGHASTSAGELAVACLRMGRDEEARRWAGECRDLSASDDVLNQHLWRRVDAVLSARERRDDDAKNLIGEAVEWVLRTDSLIDLADVYLCESEVHALAVRPDQARRALSRAAEAFERKGATVGETIVARRRERLGLT